MSGPAVSKIEKIGVIGAGVMGSGIAAQAANAGAYVVLLDVVADAARSAIESMKKANPAPLMHPTVSSRITPGCTKGDLALLEGCDWIIEAIIENTDIKQALYRSLQPHLKADAVVSSNTSTLPLRVLTEGLPDDLRRRFLITHFFNPPRYMRLMEIVAGPDTEADVERRIRAFADVKMGKSVVTAKDTPGFIANRIGIYWSVVATELAARAGLSVEEADSIVGRPMGIPKTGIFALMDLTGIDLAPHVVGSMLRLLPKDDALSRFVEPNSALTKLITRMIADGYTGRKGKGGFYRLVREGGEKRKEAIDLATGEYRPAQKPVLESAKAGRKGLRALVEHPDKGGQYAWGVLSRVLAYTASLLPEIADDIVAVDEAMKAGYAWMYGPFEQIDQLGTAWFAE
ncbi:MAG: 3-hydroxyacyl-CoA dehydrogenase family protein, partial [Alphaproteobacteria bacterium]